MSIDNRRDRVAKALADFDQTPFGEMTLTKPDGTDPRIIDTRTAYRREAERFMAMLNAAMEPSTTDAIMALLPSLPDGWVAVPEEPTGKMLWEGYDVRNSVGGFYEIYRAMLAARPTPPTEPPSEQEDKRPGWQRNLEHSFSPDPPWVAPSNIWGRTYIRYLRKGHDHGSAAFAADEAERRANTPPPQPLETKR